MSNIKVTVAMPAYNAANYIEDAIESVLAQDFDAFELIIIDDGSSDGTGDKLACYTGHPRAHLADHASNQGSELLAIAYLKWPVGSISYHATLTTCCFPGPCRI